MKSKSISIFIERQQMYGDLNVEVTVDINLHK